MGSEYTVLVIGYFFGFYMAWNIGANDVANSMASAVGAKVPVPVFLLFFGGVGIAGHRVMDTIGRKITTLNMKPINSKMPSKRRSLTPLMIRWPYFI